MGYDQDCCYKMYNYGNRCSDYDYDSYDYDYNAATAKTTTPTTTLLQKL